MIEVMYMCKSTITDKWVEGQKEFQDPRKAIRFCKMVKYKWNGLITLITGDDRDEVDFVSHKVNISKLY